MNTPPDIVNAATNATNNLLPQKSRAKYEKAYKDLLHYTDSIITVAVLYSLRVTANITRSENAENNTASWSFNDFLKKFEPKTARNNIGKARRSVQTDEEYINAMFDGIDATDALLDIDLERIDIGPEKNDTRRENTRRNNTRRENTRKNLKNLMVINDYDRDRFNYRKRLFELMKQAIYQARTEMPIWQNMRKQHREHKLYKMGFLMGKTDNAVKIFSHFVFRSYKLCYLVSFHKIDQMYFYEVLLLHERALSLWFNVQLLTDLVLRNDRSCRNTSDYYKDYLLEHWKYFN